MVQIHFGSLSDGSRFCSTVRQCRTSASSGTWLDLPRGGLGRSGLAARVPGGSECRWRRMSAVFLPPELTGVSWITWSPRVWRDRPTCGLCALPFSRGPNCPSPSPSPWHHSSCSPISVTSSFRECWMNAVTQYVGFLNRLFSPSAILLRSVRGESMFFFIPEPCFVACMHHRSGLFVCLF